MQCKECGHAIRYDSKTELCSKHLPGTEPKKLTSKPIQLILESDFDDVVTQVFGVPYQFQQQGEMKGQDSIWEFTVPEKWMGTEAELNKALDEWLKAKPPQESEFSIHLWWLRENYPDIDDVVEALARRGLIDPGEYALHIWW